ncbi:YfhD family protein [Bacillus aerolatus]|uniref:YfhD family protein n=1 Tax=Bacillus aerolatus TaxID=2653354 RepID=A0A6I1FQU1_9BACI|nr:YfhD family protein [Bacillus aerolatus]KAB7709092.1 YfhD family protein [Bacillus aerolatus]
MGRDDNKTGGNNSSSLPQTPKNLKIPPSKVDEEFSRELDELDDLKSKPERINPKHSNKS